MDGYFKHSSSRNRERGIDLDSFTGRILRVNLSDTDTEEISLSEPLAKAFLGGRALVAAFLYTELEPETDPLAPANALLFMTGPSVGTSIYSAHRSDVTTKSPLTDSYLCSSAGGAFGPELKFSGYDGIIIKGKADNPVYIFIKAGERIYNLERKLAVKDGHNRRDDSLPRRILEEPLPEGPAKGIAIEEENFNQMLEEYYEIRGWDEKGRPTEDKLKELQIPSLLG